MKPSFDDYCGAGLLVLIIAGALGMLAMLVPINAWVAIVCVLISLVITTAVCYGLGRLVYWIKDKIK